MHHTALLDDQAPWFSPTRVQRGFPTRPRDTSGHLLDRVNSGGSQEDERSGRTWVHCGPTDCRYCARDGRDALVGPGGGRPGTGCGDRIGRLSMDGMGTDKGGADGCVLEVGQDRRRRTDVPGGLAARGAALPGEKVAGAQGQSPPSKSTGRSTNSSSASTEGTLMYPSVP